MTLYEGQPSFVFMPICIYAIILIEQHSSYSDMLSESRMQTSNEQTIHPWSGGDLHMAIKYKSKAGFKLREVAGQRIVVPVGEASKLLKGVLSLNSTSMFLWKLIETPITAEEMTEALLDAYDVERSTAESDVENFLKTLLEANIIERSE